MFFKNGANRIQTGSVSVQWCLLCAAAWIIPAAALSWKQLVIPRGAFFTDILSGEMFLKWAVICVLLCICVSDIRKRMIPNSSILALIAFWIFKASAIYPIAAQNAAPDLLWMFRRVCTALLLAGGMAMAAWPAAKILKARRLGGGDLKLVFAAGLYLGFGKGLDMLFLSCLLGILTAGVYAVRKKVTGKAPLSRGVPFGPAIAAAFMVFLLAG